MIKAKMMERIIDLDPETRKIVLSRATNSFINSMAKILDDYGINALQGMVLDDIARLFYLNGFVNGAVAAATDNDFLDSVSLMNEEIEYQKNNYPPQI